MSIERRPAHPALRALYLAATALLVAHEIDAAFWREWEMFHLPGGAGGFVALHVPLVVLVVWGYGRVVAGVRAGRLMALGVAGLGLAAAAIHGAFLVAGRAEFRTPASLAVLAATALASAALAVVAAGAWRRLR